MRAPAEFGRLQAFRDEALDRPGVDEHVHRLRVLGALRVALGDVDALDAGLLGEPCPVLAGLRLLEFQAEIGGELSSACLTNHDTMPGLAPQQDTAVGPPRTLRRAASIVSRSA